MIGDLIFRSPNGDLPINSQILNKYPNCLLKKITNGLYGANYDPKDNVYQTDIDLHTLELIKYFLTNGVWKNPYIRCNQLNAIRGNHEMNCEYLQLPEYPIEDIPDDPDYEWELHEELDAELEDDLYFESKLLNSLRNSHQISEEFDDFRVKDLDDRWAWLNAHRS